MQGRTKFILLALTLLLLVACNGTSTAEKMYEHMEEAVTLEETFANQQAPLAQLEEEEKKLYDEIITLGMEEMDKVKDLTEQALTNIEERKEILEKEKQSISDAKEEFDLVKPMVEEIKEDELKAKAKELTQVMDERYQAYESLNDTYLKSLDMDKELYQMLEQEDLQEESLRAQIDKVNKTYDKVIAANNQFNEKTETYNQLKKEFYDLAEINVNYSE
ncbi:YkyA family protein [Aquibacillus salsiterrae]|uniref:YkyA family protein n=1 Tax=Aquibacillus salsiterrae TaxID=2950439 RepID=A0A9X3WCR5_9BACI|nr:YkyA family protein [Aquibacillus salsiterrae]MDC3416533.1 YkyA family protein [Aquibacillus salsiterrae]